MSNPIGWCDKTINPLVGCTPVSEGCERCYAARMASRNLCPQWRGTVKGGRWTGKINYNADEWEKPRHWRKPQRIFVCSMSDPFHLRVPDDFYIDLIFAVKDFPHHTFLLLTKRPENIYRLLQLLSPEVDDLPFDNLWLGITAENQKRFDERRPFLARANVADRFLSAEPLLRPLNIRRGLRNGAIQWVIAGPETGPGKRPYKLDWFRSIRDQCVDYGIPFCLKGIPELDGREWKEVPG